MWLSKSAPSGVAHIPRLCCPSGRKRHAGFPLHRRRFPTAKNSPTGGTGGGVFCAHLRLQRPVCHLTARRSCQEERIKENRPAEKRTSSPIAGESKKGGYCSTVSPGLPRFCGRRESRLARSWSRCVKPVKGAKHVCGGRRVFPLQQTSGAGVALARETTRGRRRPLRTCGSPFNIRSVHYQGQEEDRRARALHFKWTFVVCPNRGTGPRNF